MALRFWKCNKCEEVIRSLESAPKHCETLMELQLVAPQAKFMEPRHKAKGKSILKDQNKILKARTREHTRDFELDELIANNSLDMAKKNKWITDKGRRRTRIDDI